MNTPSQPPKPPFNDQLLQALTPVKELLNQRQKVDQIMRKYGREMPHRYQGPPTVQWEGDPNA